MVKSTPRTSPPSPQRSAVRTGADRILNDAPHLIAGKRLGILTNHTGRLSDGRTIIEAVVKSRIASVAALFAPEHGIEGTAYAGTPVGNAIHRELQIPVYSLYGTVEKPTPEMLRDIDLMLCDIQDVGARFYAFVSTVALALEACAENGLPFVLLDRPNPIGGIECDGPVRDPSLKSLVGWMPVPIVHGMTIGELVAMCHGEGWLANGVRTDLHIVQLSGWTRSMWYDETGVPWIPPSPNMRRLSTAILYPGTCLFEATSASEGRGTGLAFELIGAPWLNADAVLGRLKQFHLPGVSFRKEQFVPRGYRVDRGGEAIASGADDAL